MLQSPLSYSVAVLRQQYQQQAPSQRALQLLHGSSQLLQKHNLEQAAEGLLNLLSGAIGCQHACLLRYKAGRLHCVSAIGHAPPSQVKMPVNGFLQSLVKYPSQDMLRSPIDSPWLFMQGQYAFEWFIPLPYSAHVTGILAFAGNLDSNLPNRDLQETLCSLATLYAGLWPDGAVKRKASELDQLDLKRLSPREREIMALLPKGMSNQRIAAHLGIASGTVKTHMERILSKLQLEDRAHAAARAVELKLGSTQ